jgi:hypothetical protein
VDNLSVLKDIEAIIHRKIPTGQRGLRAVGMSPNTHWRLP